MSDLDLECILLSPPQLVYNGWLDSWIHGAITEALAAIDPRVEGDFRLWSGSVRGKFVNLIPNQQCQMTWRTVEFPLEMADTLVTLSFKNHKKGTLFHVYHTAIPDLFLEQFRFAWEDYYFPRMQRFFISH